MACHRLRWTPENVSKICIQKSGYRFILMFLIQLFQLKNVFNDNLVDPLVWVDIIYIYLLSI